MNLSLKETLRELPLVAILRGVEPEQAESVGGALVEAGFRAIEVPLNSPRPIESIVRLKRRFGAAAAIGAGTVLSAEEVGRVAAAGAQLVVAPNFDPAVVAAARRLGLWALPGVATPSEAFAALAAGADALKLFPGEQMPPPVVKAWRAVMPPGTWLLPVGGVTPEKIAPYREAGADGFGLGSALFRPGMTADEVGAAARRFAQAWRAAA